MDQARSLPNDLEKMLATMAELFTQKGQAREVAILAASKARIEQTDYDNWNGGQYIYTIYLEVPSQLYAQVADELEAVQGGLLEQAKRVARLYPADHVSGVELVLALTEDVGWREKAEAWAAGKGVNNQGRVRSDNVAPRVCDGLLFRSQPEIHLYRALRSLGVSFAPLPVFVRGGETYRRIEPDFIILKDGIVVAVEVDGDTVHRETPVEAHARTTMLVHEGAHVERVNARECESPEKAKGCAVKVLSVIDKLKANR